MAFQVGVSLILGLLRSLRVKQITSEVSWVNLVDSDCSVNLHSLINVFGLHWYIL